MAETSVASPPALATPEQVAQALEVKVLTLRNWRSLRRGPDYVKAGRAVRYRWEDVNAWLNEGSK
jgi:hypothetical protein